jgi:hypothetical protein
LEAKSLSTSVSFLPSLSASLRSASSNSGSSVGVRLVMVIRPRLLRPSPGGDTPIRSIRASSATNAPPSAGPSRSLPTSGFPDPLSNDSSKYSSAISMQRR